MNTLNILNTVYKQYKIPNKYRTEAIEWKKLIGNEWYSSVTVVSRYSSTKDKHSSCSRTRITGQDKDMIKRWNHLRSDRIELGNKITNYEEIVGESIMSRINHAEWFSK